MKQNRLHMVIVTLIVGGLFVPLFAPLVHSLSTQWGATLLPDGLTLSWYGKLFTDPRFLAALGRSLFICGSSLALCLAVVVPTVFAAVYYFPGVVRFIELLAVLPFAVPGVVIAVGLMKIYSGGVIPIAGTPWILLGAYFGISLPFIYRGMKNSLDTLDIREMVDAAQLLGASVWEAFGLIILSSIKKGVVVSSLLTFSFLFGEFLFANLLVGGRFETLQIYLMAVRQKNGPFNSALVVTIFAVVFLATGGAFYLEKMMAKRKVKHELRQRKQPVKELRTSDSL